MSSIALKYPVTTQNGETITGLTFRRANVADLKATEDARKSGGDFDAGVALLSRLSSLPTATVLLLDAEDFQNASERLVDFLPRQKTSTDG